MIIMMNMMLIMMIVMIRDNDDMDDDDDDDSMIRNNIFAGTGLLSVGSKLPGTVSPASRPSHAERTAAGPHEGTH